MKLMNVLRKECIRAKLKCSNKTDVLKETARVARQSPLLKDLSEEDLLAALQQRESLASTGIGGGIAIPHCRLDSVSDFVVGILTLDNAVDFDAIDQKPVNLILFIIAPAAEPNQHIKLLSAVSQTLSKSGVVQEITAAATPELIHEGFLRHTRADIDTDGQAPRCLMQVYIEKEDAFHDILETLAGLETCSLSVLNAENAAAYLTKSPLFADFWSDKPSAFSMLILAVMDKKLVNESIRRIEGVTGDLNQTRGIMVIVQEIFYAAGTF